MVTKARIINYMVSTIDEYPGDFIDRNTGELNMTALAEDAAEHFNDNFEDEIPEIYFEVAFEIAESQQRLP